MPTPAEMSPPLIPKRTAQIATGTISRTPGASARAAVEDAQDADREREDQRERDHPAGVAAARRPRRGDLREPAPRGGASLHAPLYRRRPRCLDTHRRRRSHGARRTRVSHEWRWARSRRREPFGKDTADDDHRQREQPHRRARLGRPRAPARRARASPSPSPCSSAGECAELAGLFDGDRFRSTIDMARHRFGDGRYRYFAHPLPELDRRRARRLLRAARADREPLGRPAVGRQPDVPGDARAAARALPTRPARRVRRR